MVEVEALADALETAGPHESIPVALAWAIVEKFKDSGWWPTIERVIDYDDIDGWRISLSENAPEGIRAEGFARSMPYAVLRASQKALDLRQDAPRSQKS